MASRNSSASVDEEGRDRVVHVGGRQSGDDDGVGVLRGEHAVVTGLADVDLVDLAVDRHGLQLLQRGVGERVALAGAVTEDLAAGLVDAQHGEQRAGRLVAHVVIAGTRPQLTVDALRGLDHLLVQLVEQLVAEGDGGRGADQQRERRDQRDGRQDQPRRERTEAVHGQATGFRTYPAPRMVWIIGSRPASIFLRR